MGGRGSKARGRKPVEIPDAEIAAEPIPEEPAEPAAPQPTEEVEQQAPQRVESGIEHAVPATDPATRVRDAFRRLAAGGTWAGLKDLRQALPDIPRQILDDTIRALDSTRGTVIVPEDNQKTLTPDDHDAAIRIGGQAKHLISIDLTEPNDRTAYLTARVRDTHHRLAARPDQPVSIGDLRHALSDITPTELDAAIHHMTGHTGTPHHPLPATGGLRMTGDYADQPELTPPPAEH